MATSATEISTPSQLQTQKVKLKTFSSALMIAGHVRLVNERNQAIQQIGEDVQHLGHLMYDLHQLVELTQPNIQHVQNELIDVKERTKNVEEVLIKKEKQKSWCRLL